jgi:pimeloyl-ACP methyl ester carboxylesterase
MPTIDLPHGTVEYRVAGPDDAAAPPVVFVHGFLVDGSLWRGVADHLATAGLRSYAPDLPLGSHRIPVNVDADQSPRGVARQVISFVEALGLDDVTLVGNDTGGAICQFLLDTDASRVGRLVLTNCDAFDQFPPAPFDLLFRLVRRPSVLRALLQPMRSTRLRHSSRGFGGLMSGKPDPAATRRMIEPALADPAIRRDASRFAQGVRPAELVEVATRLDRFEGPVRIVWGSADPFFKADLAHRLREVFAHADLVELEGCRTFVPLDEPARLAHEIASMSVGPRAARSVLG